MGQNQPASCVTSGSLSDWVPDKSLGICDLVRNKYTNQQMEKYKMSMRGVSLRQELEFYNYRKRQDSNLVRIHFVEVEKPGGYCSGEGLLNIYSQRIPLRLSEVQNLQLEDALMVIRDSLTGFDTIKDSYNGCLQVSDKMIGFDSQGTVKVWLNEHFHLNHPNSASILKASDYQNDPSAIVSQIFQMVEKHLDIRAFPQELTLYLNKEKTKLDFLRARTFLRNYSIENNLDIPDRLQLGRYTSPFKRRSQNIDILESKPNNPCRTIKIIPEALILSPRKNLTFVESQVVHFLGPMSNNLKVLDGSKEAAPCVYQQQQTKNMRPLIGGLLSEAQNLNQRLERLTASVHQQILNGVKDTCVYRGARPLSAVQT